jgi:hypothetical protein
MATATGTLTEYTSSRLVLRVPVDDGEGGYIFKNSTLIPRFKFDAATPDEIIDLANAAAVIVGPADGVEEPMHIDAITTARFLNDADSWE